MILGKNIIPKQIEILTILSIVLNFIYLVWSDSIFSLYITWNIILAFIPYLISYKLLNYRKAGGKSLPVYLVGIFFWFLFLPNAPYLITDIIHTGESLGVPLWLDAITLFSSAWVGMMLCLYSLSHIEELLLTKYSQKVVTIIISGVVLVSSFGIYLGRFLRWNSWDILIYPVKIFKEALNIIFHPTGQPEVYVFTIIFFLFIIISYYSFKAQKKDELD